MENLTALLNSFNAVEKRGKYNADEVNQFIAAVKKELARVKNDYDSLKKKNEEYESKASAMVNSLIVADQSSKKIIEDARKEAETIIASAKKEGDDYLLEMNSRAASAENELNMKKEEFSREFSTLNSIREQYQQIIMEDIEEFRRKIDSMNSSAFINELSDETKNEIGLKDSQGEDDAPAFDMTKIVKDMPVSEEELKNKIKDLF